MGLVVWIADGEMPGFGDFLDLFRQLDLGPEDRRGLVGAHQEAGDHQVDQGAEDFVVLFFRHDFPAVALEDGQYFGAQAILEDLLVLPNVDLIEFGQELEGLFSPGRDSHDGAPYSGLRTEVNTAETCHKEKTWNFGAGLGLFSEEFGKDFDLIPVVVRSLTSSRREF